VTRETRVTIEPRDIRAIELECRQCGLRATHPLTKEVGNFYKCPGCPAIWSVEYQQAYQALLQVVSGLKSLSALGGDAVEPFVIRFEIPEHKEKL
jgi:hypothetical protein